MIRYFAGTHASSTDAVALEYLKGLLRVAPVRLLSISGGMNNRWEPYAALLATPMTMPYVNVVCCPPARWTWVQQVEMPNLDPQGQVTSVETASSRVELYTVGVRNILIATHPPDPIRDEPGLASALRYQAVIVPTMDLWEAWERVDCHPHVIPLPVTDYQALRGVIIPGNHIQNR